MTLPYLFMRTADGQFVPWLASQTDLLAKDWHFIPPDQTRLVMKLDDSGRGVPLMIGLVTGRAKGNFPMGFVNGGEVIASPSAHLVGVVMEVAASAGFARPKYHIFLDDGTQPAPDLVIRDLVREARVGAVADGANVATIYVVDANEIA